MSIILNYWNLHDFCYTHGRVIPHCYDNEGHFTEFHCADKRHDDSETIICSEGQGVQISTFVGILSMRGYVIEFNDKEEYLFCTESEFDELKEQSEKEKKEKELELEKQEDLKPENPARPCGLQIVASIQDRRYKAYYKCTDFQVKLFDAKISGDLTPPYILDDYSFSRHICKDDCLFPNCPFYELRLLSELRHNHRDDYDSWVIDFTKDKPGIH